jgi:hypothetical protein
MSCERGAPGAWRSGLSAHSATAASLRSYTDSWKSYTIKDDEMAVRLRVLDPYRVTPQLMAKAKRESRKPDRPHVHAAPRGWADTPG